LTDTFRRWSARRARVWTLAAERASRPWRQSERPGPGAWAVDAGGLDGLGLVDLRQVVVGERRCAGRVLQQSVEPEGADSGDCLRQGDDLGAGGCRGDETGDRAATVVAVAVVMGAASARRARARACPPLAAWATSSALVARVCVRSVRARPGSCRESLHRGCLGVRVARIVQVYGPAAE
jgi:hypothetical protein